MRRLLASLVVGLVLLGCRLRARGEDPAAPNRTAWLYKTSGKSGWFRKETGKRWVETTAGDGAALPFEEVARTAKYVELYDSNRTMWLRLYSGHAEWRQGKKPPWFRLYEGRWVKASELPKPVSREYRIRGAWPSELAAFRVHRGRLRGGGSRAGPRPGFAA